MPFHWQGNPAEVIQRLKSIPLSLVHLERYSYCSTSESTEGIKVSAVWYFTVIPWTLRVDKAGLRWAHRCIHRGVWGAGGRGRNMCVCMCHVHIWSSNLGWSNFGRTIASYSCFSKIQQVNHTLFNFQKLGLASSSRASIPAWLKYNS